MNADDGCVSMNSIVSPLVIYVEYLCLHTPGLQKVASLFVSINPISLSINVDRHRLSARIKHIHTPTHTPSKRNGKNVPQQHHPQHPTWRHCQCQDHRHHVSDLQAGNLILHAAAPGGNGVYAHAPRVVVPDREPVRPEDPFRSRGSQGLGAPGAGDERETEETGVGH